MSKPVPALWPAVGRVSKGLPSKFHKMTYGCQLRYKGLIKERLMNDLDLEVGLEI